MRGLISLLLLFMASRTLAEPKIATPTRLTAGGSNQYMGVLSSDGKRLYYVSDRTATSELYEADLVRGSSRLLLDLDANVTWPRPSPDGSHILFISYQKDARGDACVLSLFDSSVKCLTDDTTSDVQAFWYPDGKAIGVVQRADLHGDFHLVKLHNGEKEVVLARNLSTPAISPAGDLIAFVMVDRAEQNVGVAFSMKVGQGIEFLNLLDGTLSSYRPELPGASGFPAFSTDGKWLYFTQYLNDTNNDGVIDGNDHGVLFRVAIDPGQKTPIGQPEQLTSTSMSCSYPAPTSNRLIATCSAGGSLDIYSLPLDGIIPSSWTTERLLEEVEVARDDRLRLLLLGRAEAMEAVTERRVEILRRMVLLHLKRHEFESAGFYMGLVQRLSTPGSWQDEWARAGLELVDHRKEESRLTRGALSDRFIALEEERLARILSQPFQTGIGIAMSSLVQSEVLDVLGRKAQAKEAFDRISLQDLQDQTVLLLAAERASRLLLEFNETGRLLEVYKTLSAHPALRVADRMWFAEAYVQLLTRGISRRESIARVETKLKEVEKGSDLALRLALERRLLELGQGDVDDVRKGVFDLYKSGKDLERRKALVLTTAKRAASADQEMLLYDFANTWVSFVRRDHPERKYAEDLYRFVVLERAYASAAKGNHSDARGSFYGVTLQCDDLEAHVGFIESRLAEGKDDVAETYAKRYESEDNPIRAFASAYLYAKAMAASGDLEERARLAQKALDSLAVAAEHHSMSAQIHHLHGFIAFQRYLDTGDTSAAMAAQTHYYIALDLARDNPRVRAPLLHALGLLQASVGNHTAALVHFEERARLPFTNPVSKLGLKLAQARSLFQLERDEAAAKTAEEALAIAEGDVSLSRFMPLVLDRTALYSMAAGRFDRALWLYDRLKSLLDGHGTLINRIKLEVQRGSAALGAGLPGVALSALDEAYRLLMDVTELPQMEPEFAARSPRPRLYDRNDYLALVAALKAHALRLENRLSEAHEAMSERVQLLKQRLERLDLDEDIIALASAYYHLAEYSYHRGDIEGAFKNIEQGRRLVHEFSKRTGTEVTDEGLRLLQAALELHLYKGIPLSRFNLDLIGEAEQIYNQLVRSANPRWDGERFLLGMYLSLLRVTEKTQ